MAQEAKATWVVDVTLLPACASAPPCYLWICWRPRLSPDDRASRIGRRPVGDPLQRPRKGLRWDSWLGYERTFWEVANRGRYRPLLLSLTLLLFASVSFKYTITAEWMNKMCSFHPAQ